jgi:hypothetical protein
MESQQRRADADGSEELSSCDCECIVSNVSQCVKYSVRVTLGKPCTEGVLCYFNDRGID